MSLPINIRKTAHMSVDAQIDKERVVVRVTGQIDEDFAFTTTFAELKKLSVGLKLVVFDLGCVTRLNSTGIREWLLFIERVQTWAGLLYRNVSEGFIEQACIVPDLLGPPGTPIESFMAPYLCGKCNKRFDMLLRPAEVIRSASGPEAPARNCDQCRSSLEIDSSPAEYFSFLKRNEGLNGR